MGRLKPSRPVFIGTGEGPFDMAEELAFEQAFGKSAAIDPDIGARGAGAKLMDRAGDQLFARARFAGQQHGGRSPGHQAGESGDLQHGRAGSNDPGQASRAHRINRTLTRHGTSSTQQRDGTLTEPDCCRNYRRDAILGRTERFMKSVWRVRRKYAGDPKGQLPHRRRLGQQNRSDRSKTARRCIIKRQPEMAREGDKSPGWMGASHPRVFRDSLPRTGEPCCRIGPGVAIRRVAEGTLPHSRGGVGEG